MPINPVNPVGQFISELRVVRAIEVVMNGNDVPIVILNKHGRRYSMHITAEDVTDDPFYNKDGLFQRLARRRKR